MKNPLVQTVSKWMLRGLYCMECMCRRNTHRWYSLPNLFLGGEIGSTDVE